MRLAFPGKYQANDWSRGRRRNLGRLEAAAPARAISLDNCSRQLLPKIRTSCYLEELINPPSTKPVAARSERRRGSFSRFLRGNPLILPISAKNKFAKIWRFVSAASHAQWTIPHRKPLISQQRRTESRRRSGAQPRQQTPKIRSGQAPAGGDPRYYFLSG